ISGRCAGDAVSAARLRLSISFLVVERLELALGIGEPGVRRIDPRAQLAHDIERALRVLGDQDEKNFGGDRQRPHRGLRPDGGPARAVSNDAHLADQLVAVQYGDHEFPSTRFPDYFGLAIEDHVRAVGRIAPFYQIVARRELERATRESEKL